jgi:MFS family permease
LGRQPTLTEGKPRFYYGYVVILAAFFAALVVWGTKYTFGVFFKPIATEFGWTRAITAGAFSLSTVLRGLGMFGMGRLTDKLGPRLVITVCGVFLGAGYLLMSQVNTIWQLYLFYGVLVAIGMSASYVPITSTIARWFVNRRGMMTGIVLSGSSLGVVIFAPAAQRLISSYDWRTSYIVIGLIALILIVAAAQFMKRNPPGMREPPRSLSETMTSDGRESGSASSALGFSLGEAIQTRQLWMLMIVNFSACFAIELVMVHIHPHATEVGISATRAANILAVIGGIGVLTRLPMGLVADRIGARLAMFVGFALLIIALAGFVAAKEEWMFYLFAGAFGAGYGGFITLLPLLVAELFGLSSHGAIMGVVMFAGLTFGGALGPVLGGAIFDVTSSYDLAFLIATLLAIVSLGLVLLLRAPSR